MCNCEFEPIPGDEFEGTPETACHYRRTCNSCGGQWWSLHCPHELHQTPCPHCGVTPTPEPDVEGMEPASYAKH